MRDRRQNHNDYGGEDASPDIVQHHAGGVAATVGPTDKPGLPDVEQAEQQKGRPAFLFI